jgi:hypothetical protein
MEDPEACTGPDAVAGVSNFLPDDDPRAAGLEAREGHVLCELMRRGSLPRGPFGPEVERIHYQGEDWTYVRVLNVACDIWPSEEWTGPAQIDRLEAALRDLPGAR